MMENENRVPVPLPSKEDKCYPKDFPMELTSEPDCLDPFPDDDIGDGTRKYTVRMKCGHTFDPDTLTDYCRTELDNSIDNFTCPAIIDDKSMRKCKQEWDYADVRLAALLTKEEMIYFEYKMSRNAASKFWNMKECPSCESFVERKKFTQEIRVVCSLCTATKGCLYEFCWQCMHEWTGPTSLEKCGRPDCIHPDIPALRDAPMIIIDEKECPNRRACPNCGKVVEILNTHCRMMTCPRCKDQYCFLCLESKERCLNASTESSKYGSCSNVVAPKQTVIPRNTLLS